MITTLLASFVLASQPQTSVYEAVAVVADPGSTARSESILSELSAGFVGDKPRFESNEAALAYLSEQGYIASIKSDILLVIDPSIAELRQVIEQEELVSFLIAIDGKEKLAYSEAPDNVKSFLDRYVSSRLPVGQQADLSLATFHVKPHADYRASFANGHTAFGQVTSPLDKFDADFGSVVPKKSTGTASRPAPLSTHVDVHVRASHVTLRYSELRSIAWREAGNFYADTLKERKDLLSTKVNTLFSMMSSRYPDIFGEMAKPGKQTYDQGSQHLRDIFKYDILAGRLYGYDSSDAASLALQSMQFELSPGIMFGMTVIGPDGKPSTGFTIIK